MAIRFVSMAESVQYDEGRLLKGIFWPLVVYAKHFQQVLPRTIFQTIAPPFKAAKTLGAPMRRHRFQFVRYRSPSAPALPNRQRACHERSCQQFVRSARLFKKRVRAPGVVAD